MRLVDSVLDARGDAAAQQGDVLAAYEALAVGSSFVLVSDHDPVFLRRQLQSRHPGAFSWTALEPGPSSWRVSIVRTSTGQSPAPFGGDAA